CCKSSANESVYRPPMERFEISLLRSGHCHPDIRWNTCCAMPRTSGKRQGLLMLFCTRRTMRIQSRNYSILLREEDWRSGGGLDKPPIPLNVAPSQVFRRLPESHSFH